MTGSANPCSEAASQPSIAACPSCRRARPGRSAATGLRLPPDRQAENVASRAGMGPPDATLCGSRRLEEDRPMPRLATAGAILLLSACASPDQPPATADMSWACPDGYEVKEGLNTGFPQEGMMRAFIVVPAKGVAGAAPAWVPLSGTVESANANLHVDRSGANAKLADHGFTVIGPIRQCAEQDPDIGFAECDGPGSNGWNWKPWNDG